MGSAERIVRAWNQSFLASDPSGQIDGSLEAPGYFVRDTRHLSRFEVWRRDGPGEPRRLDEGLEVALADRCEFRLRPRQEALEISLQADFADLFEVRGFPRSRRGRYAAPRFGPDGAIFAYEGLDEIWRQTRVSWSVKPSQITVVWGDELYDLFDGAPLPEDAPAGSPRPAVVHLRFPLGLSRSLYLTVVAFTSDSLATRVYRRRKGGFLRARHQEEEKCHHWLAQSAEVLAADARLTRAAAAGRADLGQLAQDFGRGLCPVAGLPWYASPFGRDSIIASLQALPFAPGLARGTLLTLAAWQGEGDDPTREEEPGKIVHEIRFGEMATRGEVAFGRYYGTVDATPLWVTLLAETVRWTGDRLLLLECARTLHRSLDWILASIARGGGFLRYESHRPDGLRNHGWKDSGEAIHHADGTWAEGPIAVVEAQGYAVRALRDAAWLFRQLGEYDDRVYGDAPGSPGLPLAPWPSRLALADHCEAEAASLAERIARHFWQPDLGAFALALDGQDRPCRVAASNPGHLLWSRAVPPELVPELASRLTQPDLWTGFGIRTLSSRERRFDPLSYHNGSVWPHDNSLIALGMAGHRLAEPLRQLTDGLLRATQAFPGARLPELFGVHDGAITPVPIACSPQAWAAGTPWMLVQAMLGLEPVVPVEWPSPREGDPAESRLVLRPMLPPWCPWLEVRNLWLGRRRVSLRVERLPQGYRAQADGAEVEVRD